MLRFELKKLRIQELKQQMSSQKTHDESSPICALTSLPLKGRTVLGICNHPGGQLPKTTPHGTKTCGMLLKLSQKRSFAPNSDVVYRVTTSQGSLRPREKKALPEFVARIPPQSTSTLVVRPLEIISHRVSVMSSEHTMRTPP